MYYLISRTHSIYKGAVLWCVDVLRINSKWFVSSPLSSIAQTDESEEKTKVSRRWVIENPFYSTRVGNIRPFYSSAPSPTPDKDFAYSCHDLDSDATAFAAS